MGEFTSGPPAWIDWNGQRWYRINERQGKKGGGTGHYRNSGGDLLHRIVWQREHGPIPGGGIIHHDDHDKANNEPGNLVLIDSTAEHSREHGNAANHPAFQANRDSSKARERSMRYWAGREPTEHTCEECGGTFWSRGTVARFCGNNCKARHYRGARAAGPRRSNKGGTNDGVREYWREKQPAEFTCVNCGNTFRSRATFATYCSKPCAAQYRRAQLKAAALS